ncbi:MFS transporter [Plantactinospora sp. GCM10030261]|uniref:MFS transporter n=1 Tax=Plantactinospora sp. GCM10030261 TaxID=3273420 RepID=UPI00361A8390
MPTDRPVAAGIGGGHRHARRGWRIVAALAVTQTVGYGTLYYSFAVLLQPMTVDLRASATEITGAFTAAILTWAVMAAPVGRWLDRHGGRALMTCGSLLGTGLLAAWSQVRTTAQLYAVFVGIGIAMAMALYEPATAVLVSWFDPDRRPRALLGMIVVAGFASTIFLPLTGQLVDRYGWRTALVILAGVHGVVTVPLHAVFVRRQPTMTRTTTSDGNRTGRLPVAGAVLRDGRFWLLAAAFVAHSAAMSTMTVHLVGFLASRGHSATFAATIAGLLGVFSVTGRLLLAAGHRRIRMVALVAGIFAVQATAAGFLPLLARSRVGAIIGVVTFGLGFGVASLAAPVLLADRYGTAGYATIAGILATPVTVARAGAPFAAAALLTTLDAYPPVLAAIAAACGVAAAGILARARHPSLLSAVRTVPVVAARRGGGSD